jgi:hypothetical protein
MDGEMRCEMITAYDGGMPVATVLDKRMKKVGKGGPENTAVVQNLYPRDHLGREFLGH